METKIFAYKADTEDVGGKVQQARVTTYVPHDVKEKLEQIAETEERTLSNLVSIILKRYVEQVEDDWIGLDKNDK
jgi:predicted DNA-binding protein